VRLYLKNVYNKLKESTTKSMRSYEQYLGEKLDDRINPTLPQYKPSAYVSNSLCIPPSHPSFGTPIMHTVQSLPTMVKMYL
jgi:hypothetical protein